MRKITHKLKLIRDFILLSKLLVAKIETKNKMICYRNRQAKTQVIIYIHKQCITINLKNYNYLFNLTAPAPAAIFNYILERKIEHCKQRKMIRCTRKFHLWRQQTKLIQKYQLLMTISDLFKKLFLLSINNINQDKIHSVQ